MRSLHRLGGDSMKALESTFVRRERPKLVIDGPLLRLDQPSPCCFNRSSPKCSLKFAKREQQEP